MHDPNNPTQPSDELTQHFWQAWREQLAKTPRLARLFLQHGRQLLERFQRIYAQLYKAPRPLRRRWQRKLGTSLAGVALALALSHTPIAHALPPALEAHINGTDCLLVDAITAANTDTATGDCAAGNPGADTIELLDNVTLYYVNSGSGSSTNGLPNITSEITIEGGGYSIARDASAPQFRIFAVESSGDLTLNDTTIAGGNLPDGGNGGGIINRGSLTLNNSTVSGNSSGTNNSGGGIYSGFGSATTLTNSTVSGNSARWGGGIAMIYSTVTLSNSTITNNAASTNGGGIYNFGSTLTLERSLISGNTAPSAQEIQNDVGGCVSAADVNTPTCLASASAINSADLNLFGHDGETNAQAFYGFVPDVDDIVATSDGNTPTALSAILDTTLQNNGGDTETHALVAGSPAVDAATNGPATDQRGVSRPQGPAFDIGAYELEQASNQDPTVTANDASVTVDEGQTASNSGTVSDPDGNTVTLSASIGTVLNNNDGTWSWSFDTTDGPPNSQTVTITADDGNGGTSSTTFDLTVSNVAPSVGTISAPADPQQTGATVNASASFSDPGSGDTHTAAWDWGDGSTSGGTVGSGTVGPDSHTYTTPGVYTVQLTVTDDDGGVGESIYQFVVVYDPAGGFVTGGGWITSPAGAYPTDPALTGKANFGFNSKYKKGQSTPDGSTEFQFQVANLKFKSSSYDWLVVSGPHAKFKGVGTINGSGNYGFMLTATDGQVNGGGGVDKFRIKIWDKDNGDAIIYDNQMGQGDDSNAGTALGGGSIVIHKGGNGNKTAIGGTNTQSNTVFLPLVER